MKKLLFGISLILFSTPILAQTNVLFPELQGQFKPTQKSEQVQPVLTEEPANTPQKKVDLFASDFQEDEEQILDGFDLFENDSLSEENDFSDNTTLTDDEISAVSEQSEDENSANNDDGSGNLRIEIQDVYAMLPYARNMAYCKANFVLTNETNQTLDSLTLEVSYDGNTNTLTFNGVKKKEKQERPFFMVGPECSAMDALPQFEIKDCKMGKLSMEACQKRVQMEPLP